MKFYPCTYLQPAIMCVHRNKLDFAVNILCKYDNPISIIPHCFRQKLFQNLKPGFTDQSDKVPPPANGKIDEKGRCQSSNRNMSSGRVSTKNPIL